MDDIMTMQGTGKCDAREFEALVDQYVPYVSAIVRGIMKNILSQEDVEEVVSDVFFAVWKNAEKLENGKVKAYLGAIARNMAKNRLRQNHITLPLEEDNLNIRTDGPEEEVDVLELAGILREAIEALPEPDREIFWRYYYYYQTAAEIAEALRLNAATVRTKLARGRKKLKEHLEQRGYPCED